MNNAIIRNYYYFELKILVTGCAGFIGYHLCKRLLKNDIYLIGIDNLNSYYDINLKQNRLEKLNLLSQKNKKSWSFFKINIEDKQSLENVYQEFKPEIIVHLAAQAGVRYSIENPDAYISSNLVGFHNILELSRKFDIKNLIYASSSSIYGGNIKVPFEEDDSVDHPVSLYAATKRSNELMAHSYSHLYGLSTIGLRFFTVYGPWGRPDMAPMIFTDSIISGKPIKVFNFGDMYRDFTYIDDVIEIIIRLLNKPAKLNEEFNKHEPKASDSWSPYLIFNIGKGESVCLQDFIKILEQELNINSIKEYLPMQKGDVKRTFADTIKIQTYIGYKPKVSLKDGIKEFINWYKKEYMNY